jgi:DNA repair protein RecO
MTRGRATYMEREARDLVRLDRVEPTETLLGSIFGREAGEADRVLGHAAYFAELLDEWAPNDAPNERLFRLGTAVSSVLGRGDGSIDALARYFEYWLLRIEGVYPALDRCPRCEVRFEGAVRLSTTDRAYVCCACQGQGPLLSKDALEFLRGLGATTPAQVAGRQVAAGTLRELDMAHHQLIATHLEKTLRSSRVIKDLGSHS